MADWDDGGGDASMEPIRETGVVKVRNSIQGPKSHASR